MLDYSIVIPVFNKAAFTKRCLETLPPTLANAGDGEVIVVDNASTDETPEVLAAFPWIRVVRNETNLGFAGANNQGARLAQGRFLVLLNNDTQAHPGWLARLLKTAAEPGVGAVGARLLFPNETVQHAGVAISPVFLSRLNFVALHVDYKLPANDPRVVVTRDMAAVTGACLVTPRDLYLGLGGLDEAFWNGYEDVDYCLKVRAEGLRVVYDGRASLYHFESQSGAQRFRKTIWNAEMLRERHPEGVEFDVVAQRVRQGAVRHMQRTTRGGIDLQTWPIPPVTLVVHSAAASDRGERFIDATSVPVERVITVGTTAQLDPVNDALRVRGFRYAAFVHAETAVRDGWLEELIRQVENSSTCAAATTSERLPLGENVRALAPDARCTLLSLEKFPAHLELQPFDTWDAAVADLAMRALPLQVGTRGAGSAIADLPPVGQDAGFAREHGLRLDELHRDELVEERSGLPELQRGLVSIVTLSWNAPAFTKLALDSIRERTSEPYEVIVVDNGSGPETLEMLRAIDDPHVRVVYNPVNRGFAGGNNDGLAVARGEHVILLNNDVIVSDGWIEGLLRPFAQVAGVGVTAPRSNRVVGHQMIYDAIYEGDAGLHAYARERAKRYRGRGYVTDRAIGFCLCISRTVLEHVGGLDESFGAGNFEDDDYCLRVRGAGYKIYVCDDVFIHHFGSQSFAANNVDYAASMHGNWSVFSKKWGYPATYPVNGYQPSEAIRRGFDPARHFVPFVQRMETSDAMPLVLWGRVETDVEWERMAPFVRRYMRAFTAADRVELHLTVGAGADPDVIARRIERAASKLGMAPESMPEIVVTDEEPQTPVRRAVAEIEDSSPSALRRMLGTAAS